MKGNKPNKRRLVADAAEQLRELILSRAPDTYIGSLGEVAGLLGVGIVTVQQAARILEHEGLLSVKRGPGGGYYGTRPDDAAMERVFATYMRVHEISYQEAFELSVLLDCEIIQAAAQGCDASNRSKINGLLDQLEKCDCANDAILFEDNFRATLLQIFSKPLLELLSRVAMQLYTTRGDPEEFTRLIGLEEWKMGRQRILRTILQNDAELAYFEAQRFRSMILQWMSRGREVGD